MGGEIDFAGILGSVSVNAAYSRAGELIKRDEQALTIGYGFTRQNSLYKQSFALQWRSQSPAFTSLSPQPSDIFVNPVSSSYAGRYSQNIICNIAMTLSGTYLRHLAQRPPRQQPKLKFIL